LIIDIDIYTLTRLSMPAKVIRIRLYRNLKLH